MRLIDADVLLDAICGCFNIMEAQGIDVTVARTIAKGVIDAAPAIDAAPVVRCMDCKNWDNSTEGRYVGGWCFCEKLQFSTSPDWFCADGERVDSPTCGPDYCEIGGEDDADGETPLSS